MLANPKNYSAEEIAKIGLQEYLTVAEAVLYFGIGQNYMNKILKSPDCDFVLKVGNRRYVNRDKCKAYIASLSEIQ